MNIQNVKHLWLNGDYFSTSQTMCLSVRMVYLQARVHGTMVSSQHLPPPASLGFCHFNSRSGQGFWIGAGLHGFLLLGDHEDSIG